MLRRSLLATVVALVLLASVTGPVLAQGPDDPEGTDLVGWIAEDLGMSREELLQELLTGKTLRQVAAERGVEPAKPWQPLPPGLALETVAQALGMEPDALRDALGAGQTVPEIVADAGMDPAEVAASIKAEIVAHIEAAVDAGKVDADRAQAAIERLEASDAIEQWLAGEVVAHPALRRWLRPAIRALEWLWRHPVAARTARRLLKHTWPGLAPSPVPGQ